MSANGIYGLSGSGMDVESMVKVGMMKKQNEYDKMMQAQTIDEWTKTAYLDVNSKLTTFNMSTLSQYKMSSTMNAKTAESTSSAIKVTANASAPLMNHKVKVTELSSAAHLISNAKLTRYQGAKDSSIELKDVLFQKLEYDEDTKTVTALRTGKNPDSSGSPNGKEAHGLDFKDTAISFYITDGVNDDNDGKGVEISFTYEEIINGATLNDLVSRINGKGLNVKASYDTVNDKFSLYNTKGGEENTIKITTGNDVDNADGVANVAGTTGLIFLNALNLTQVKNGEIVQVAKKDANGDDVVDSEGNTVMENRVLHLGSVSTASKKSDEITGESGTINVDGMEYKTSDNKITIGGITYNALETTSEAATVSVSQDVDEIVDKVKSFVEDYNKLLSSLRDIYDEKRDTNYKPLTPAQKEAMKEEQIDKWEEKAKKGLLYHDQALGKIIDEMRNAISEPIENLEGKYNSAYSIGISTTGQKGQLVLDETKLRKALSEDSDAVYNVFAKLDNSQKDKNGNVINNPSGNGLAQRLGDIFTAANKTIKNIAGSSEAITEDSVLNTRMRERQTKMSDFKKTMQALEDILYKKYDTMEEMLASLYAQMNFITSCFQQY